MPPAKSFFLEYFYAPHPSEEFRRPEPLHPFVGHAAHFFAGSHTKRPSEKTALALEADAIAFHSPQPRALVEAPVIVLPTVLAIPIVGGGGRRWKLRQGMPRTGVLLRWSISSSAAPFMALRMNQYPPSAGVTSHC